MAKKINVAVVGATGVVGTEALAILEQRAFPVGDLKLYASGRSAGTEMPFRGRPVKIENLALADFRGIDVVLSAPGASVSREFAPRATAAGAVVVDKSSAFRMDPDVPLVVPEVNGDLLDARPALVSSPNCSTIPLVLLLWPLHQEFGLRRVVVSTYQAVSGAGKAAGDELINQCVAMLSHRPMEVKAFPHQMAFNVLPHVENFEPDGGGYSTEELKIIAESRKVMAMPDLRLTATATRVPVLNGHSESINVEFETPVTPEAIRELLMEAPGVSVVDDPMAGVYPMPLDASGRDEVLVGRIRRDESVESGANLWLASDNIRKGAALNAVQIVERLFGLATSA